MKARAFCIMFTAALVPWMSVADPCGRVDFSSGQVILEQPMPVEVPLSQNTMACLDRVATELLSRPNLLSITVSAQTPDAQRHASKALESAQLALDHLKTRGFPAEILTAVAPVGRGDGTLALQIFYKDRAIGPPVALVQNIQGVLLKGEPDVILEDIETGALLREGDRILTDANSTTTLVLVDDTELTLGPGSALRLGYFDPGTYPEGVRVQLESGTAHVHVARAQATTSPFELRTETAFATTHGAAFRAIAEGEANSLKTRIECLDGNIEFRGAVEGLVLESGQNSSVDSETGVPTPAAPLRQAPRFLMPQSGTVYPNATLEWQPAEPGDVAYHLEFARDPDFVLETMQFRVDATTAALPAGLSGRWFWRVSAVDANGFRGYTSKIHGFTASQDPPPPPPSEGEDAPSE